MDMDRTRAIKEAHVMDVDDEEVLGVVTATFSSIYPATCVVPDSGLNVEHRRDV